MLLQTSLLVLLACCVSLGAAFDINGWYPCTLTDIAQQSWLNDIVFECATVETPLCHSNMCNSTKTIELFVKRKLGINNEKYRETVWFLAGGPGASSADRFMVLEVVEVAMLEIFAVSNSTVDVYTMDHRGTGRSSFLDCVAAQALAEGSPEGSEISLTELPYCIDDVLHQIDGHTQAFSVTSAAKDVLYLLDGFAAADDLNAGETYLYGVSYGTFLVERVMHLAPSQVKGYILDGVVSESGPSTDTRLLFSHWDHNILGPSRRFLELCQQQTSCPLQLDVNDDEDVLDTVLDIYADLDESPNDCAELLIYLAGSGVPSEILRPFIGMLVRDPSVRELAPSILARMQRCSSKDFQELELVLEPLLEMILKQTKMGIAPAKAAAVDVLRTTLGPSLIPGSMVDSIDELVYILISFSELWAKPSPSEDEIVQFYQDGVFSLGSLKLATYCLVSGNLSPEIAPENRDTVCNQVAVELDEAGLADVANATKPYVYPLDEYSNRSAIVPPNASLLMINGGLDFQTPWEYGRYQFDATTLGDPLTSQKMLVEFDFGAHACGLSATTANDDTLCGPKIVGSFIAAGGDTLSVDTQCVAEVPELNLTDNMFALLVESLLESQREQMLTGGMTLENRP